jgi:hypothetical protein
MGTLSKQWLPYGAWNDMNKLKDNIYNKKWLWHKQQELFRDTGPQGKKSPLRNLREQISKKFNKSCTPYTLPKV